MKKIVGKYVLLSHPNFSENFIIHADWIKMQLGGVIIQDYKPIDFYLRKLFLAQRNYTTTEIELLITVETLI